MYQLNTDSFYTKSAFVCVCVCVWCVLCSLRVHEERVIKTPRVSDMTHCELEYMYEYPVNISALKSKEFYALVVSCFNTACNNNNSVVINFSKSSSK